MDDNYMKSRAKRYHFLSTLLRDEIPLELIAAMQREKFLESFKESVKGCGFLDIINGAEVITRCLKSNDTQSLFNYLRYDYADMFLNAGPNPVFPYESVHITGEPVVMQDFIEIFSKINTANGYLHSVTNLQRPQRPISIKDWPISSGGR
ncbi:MAG: hypothetical protein B1H13_12095 [Desulfobacteraceae bacterium 4484_190.3]|nr:MAG: hypothetical protein B1H13_12095 [Desulfobacteraceae bacterium 4484_190.3]